MTCAAIMARVEQESSGEDFLTTRWSIVRGAAALDPERARAALATLCRSYWYPLYAFVRRKGVAAQDAEDVVQSFFARILEKGGFDSLSPEKGRFRSFLLASIQNHLANLRGAARAEKRGAGRSALDIDFARADTRFALEAKSEAAERAFEREWALALLDRALAGLEQEYRASERGELFDVLKAELTAVAGSSHAEYARRLGSNEGAVKVAVHRLRKRYRERLRAEIAETVADPGQIESEIADLFEALGN